jgi:hypothetical protein
MKTNFTDWPATRYAALIFDGLFLLYIMLRYIILLCRKRSCNKGPKSISKIYNPWGIFAWTVYEIPEAYNPENRKLQV